MDVISAWVNLATLVKEEGEPADLKSLRYLNHEWQRLQAENAILKSQLARRKNQKSKPA